MMSSRSRHAWVTGFPGFIARRLVKKLLAADDAIEVSVLVEASHEAHAQEEVLRLSESEHHAGAPVAGRLHLMLGDIAAMDVGLSGSEFRSLAQKVTEVYHLAAVHSPRADRRQLQAVNVLGTSNVLAVARAMQRLERFMYFSSAYVSGDRTGVILEEELECGQGFRNAFEETKHRAEVLVRHANSAIPVTILRPAGVVGDSRTGEIDRSASVYQMIMLLAALPVGTFLPIPGEGRAPLNIAPVDYIVDVAHAISLQPKTAGKTFHVVDPNPMSTRTVVEMVAKRSGRKTPRYQLPVHLTKRVLRIPGLERFSSVDHQAIDYLNHMVFYNARNTMDAIDGTGIRCPSLEDYVDHLISYAKTLDATTRSAATLSGVPMQESPPQRAY